MKTYKVTYTSGLVAFVEAVSLQRAVEWVGVDDADTIKSVSVVLRRRKPKAAAVE